MDDVRFIMYFEVFSADGLSLMKTSKFEQAVDNLPKGGMIVQVKRTTVSVSEKTEVVKELRKTIMD